MLLITNKVYTYHLSDFDINIFGLFLLSDFIFDSELLSFFNNKSSIIKLVKLTIK